jgi:hypothetical protein
MGGLALCSHWLQALMGNRSLKFSWFSNVLECIMSSLVKLEFRNTITDIISAIEFNKLKQNRSGFLRSLMLVLIAG